MVNSFLQRLRVILHPAESIGRKKNHEDSLCRKPVFADGSLGRKQEIVDSLGSAEAKKDGQPRQEAKSGGLVYTACY